jgi:predicted nucleotidyltransferase
MPSPDLQVPLAPEERRVVERLIEVLEREFSLEALWLYGSRARGEEPGPESDIDLLAITPGGWGDLRAATRQLHRIADEEGADPTDFALFVFDPAWVDDRRRIDSFFIQEVDRDKKVLYGEP